MSTRFQDNVYQWLKNKQYCLLPGTCIGCRKATYRNKDLCWSCEASMPYPENPCYQCGLSLPVGYSGNLCGTCLVLPPPWERLVTAFTYSPPLTTLISSFKYKGKLVNGHVLTDCLLSRLEESYRHQSWPDLVIPVPLHSKRVRQRGFNQALEIARLLSKRLGIALDSRAVFRHKNTEHQTGLTSRQRKENIRGVFGVHSDFKIHPAMTVAIIDDVVTTGFTIAELAKTLQKNGVKKIHVWTLARTVL